MVIFSSSKISKCSECAKSINSTARKKKCCVCYQYYHTLCIPQVTKFDDFYVNTTDDWICTQCLQFNLPFNHFDDDDLFIEAISELSKVSYAECLKLELDGMIFNPFELNSEFELNPLINMDPDTQFFNHVGGCHISSDYYLEDAFNDKCQQKSVTPDSFSMIHLNIRSAPKNLNKFDSYLKILNIKFSLIAITETWYNDDNHDLYGLDGYKMVEDYRKDKRGGGAAIYVRDSIVYKKT